MKRFSVRTSGQGALPSIGLAIVLAGCSSSPLGSSSRPGSPPATFHASSGPSASDVATATVPPTILPAATTSRPTDVPATGVWAQDPPEPILVGTAVRILVDELNIREAPTTDAKRSDTYRQGQIILVEAHTAPVDADGYVWYQGAGPFGDGAGKLEALPQDPYVGADWTGGWFAARKGATRYVTPVTPRCPSAIDLENLGAMLPAERLGCFEGRTIELDGTFLYGCPTCEFFGMYAPAWLADPNIFNYISETGEGSNGRGLNLRFPPDLLQPENGSIIRARGHFDDPAAAECSIGIVPWDYRTMIPAGVPPSVAELMCRQQLVVESFEVLGTDPTFEEL